MSGDDLLFTQYLTNPCFRQAQSPLVDSSEISLSEALARLLPKPEQQKLLHDESRKSLTTTNQPLASSHLSQLPPYSTTSLAIDRFFVCQSALQHLYFAEEIETKKTLKDVYAKGCQLLTLCELFATAAVGCSWADNIPKEAHATFFDTVKAHLDQCLEKDELKGMKILALAALYSMSEKKVSSWGYVCKALQIAHSRNLQVDTRPNYMTDADWVGYRRLWRTLLFLENFLATSLGRIPIWSAAYDTIELAELERSDDARNSSRRNSLQTEIVNIGFLASRILKSVFAPPVIDLGFMCDHMAKLNLRYDNLPEPMKLGKPGLSPGEYLADTSLFTLHMVYLGTVILLTRRVVVELAGGAGGDSFEGSTGEALSLAKACLSAGRETSELLGNLYSHKDLFKNCWVTIYSSFNAGLILLFYTAQKRMLGQPYPQYQEDLAAAARCTRIVEYCAEHDDLANCYLRLLKPFRQAAGDDIDTTYYRTSSDPNESPETSDPSSEDVSSESSGDAEIRAFVNLPFSSPHSHPPKTLPRMPPPIYSSKSPEARPQGSPRKWISNDLYHQYVSHNHNDPSSRNTSPTRKRSCSIQSEESSKRPKLSQQQLEAFLRRVA
ncbi:hypothetical protein L873DRAFT_1834595 [Choiromyces venosus 120613-1]|uniref:Transcription factor domain-containing protein n=1 Tax=Choiromyces venosus 120613-1 TaxID=1336337 RepID=A0A3N4JZR2_9PEZI|nr:hypothetical protein L873DRAFT_1834595 [Choiromyces venosus 120613-1]